MSDTNTPSITIDALVSAWNSHDPTRIAALYAVEAVFEDVPLGQPLHGQAEVAAMITSLATAFPDFVMTAGKRVEQGEFLVWEWIITGTHQGNFLDIPATGRAVQVRGVSFCCVRGSKVAEQREYWDLMSVLQQLGVMKEPLSHFPAS